MFKQSVKQTLPTFLQYLKECENVLVGTRWPIEKVLWGDKFRSITFCSPFFRYSIKFGSQDEYRDATNGMMEMISSDYQVCAELIYDEETCEMEVAWSLPTPTNVVSLQDVSQFDWGLILTTAKALKTKQPAKQKKPVSLADKTPKA